MKLPNYKELVNMDYKLIFDYYDQPLSFVAKIGSSDYLFYYISDEEYFLTQVDTDIATKLNDLKNLTKLYEYLKQKQKIEIVSFDFKNKKVKYIPLNNFKDAKKYLPKSGENITFDYQNEIEINSNTNLLNYIDIPVSLSSLAVRLVNSSNSHSLSANVIKNTIDYIINIYNVGVTSTHKLFNNSDDVFISSFSPGSFIINFELPDADVNDKTFDSLSKVVQKMTTLDSKPDINLFSDDTNKKIFTNTQFLYDDVLKKDNINIEFYKSNTNNSKDKQNEKIEIKPNKFVSDNIKAYDKILKDTEKIVKKESISVETKTIENAHFISGSLSRNILTFVDNINGKQSAKFETKLYKKIKDSRDEELILSLQEPVDLTLQIETIDNKSTGEKKTKNIITDYKYVKRNIQ